MGVLALAFAVLAASANVPVQAASKKASLKTKKVTVRVGAKTRIRIKKKKKKAKYSYKCTNRKVATVSSKGVIKGKKKGSAKIKVTEKWKGKRRKLGTVKVTVKAKKKVAVSTTGTKKTPVVSSSTTSTSTATATATPSPTPENSPTPSAPTGDGVHVLKLNGVKNTSGTGTLNYDAATNQLSVKDVSYFHIPLPESMAAGSQVKATIKGIYNGSDGFRLWLAAEGDGNFSEQPSFPYASKKGEFTWEVSLTATDKISYIEFKGPTWDKKIDDLILTNVEVSYKKNTEPTPTPIPMPTDLPEELVPARETTAPGTHATAGLPLIYTDIPDMDYIRVGEDYYMVSTTMFLNPGVPIMHSKDLVHWEIISYVYDTLEDNDITNLQNGKECYGRGSWAASLRYNEADETFYVCFSSNDQNKTYIYTTKDITGGVWEKHSANGTKHDPGLIFDDGKMYIVCGNGNITIQEAELSGDAIQYKGTAKTIIKGAKAGNIVNIEGCHAYKIGDYYYLFFIEWPGGGKRMQWCYRSTSLTGTDWEGKVVFCDDGNFNGAGIAQGGIVDTIHGDWYAILFQDHGAVGRTPALLDVYWVDGWPVHGSDGGKASASEALDVNLTSAGKNYVYADDTFDYTENKLQLVWQWNHNPDNANWSVTEREGYLRLRTGSTASSIKDARNSLTQRTYGPSCTSEVSMDVSQMKAGDYAGICAFQTNYGQVGVMKDEDGKAWIYYGSGKDTMTVKDADKVSLNQDTVYLRIAYNFTSNKATFQYSLDGKAWNAIGSSLTMSYDLKVFMGYRTYLYNYATEQTGGYVDFDYYKIYD